MMIDSVSHPAGFVHSLESGLSVIRSFSDERPRLTLSEVARQTGLSRASARRSLLTLQTLGYVASDDRKFFLTPRVLTLGYAYLSSLSFADVAQGHLADLANEVHESCSASVLDGFEIVYVARAATKRIMTISLSVGTRLPAYATSMGRVLLAGLSDDQLEAYLGAAKLAPLTERTIVDRDQLRAEVSRTRIRGWCMVDQELEHGVRSIAVPVHDASGRIVAAVNTSAHATRVPLTTLQKSFLAKLKDCAVAIDTELRAASVRSP
ncbi:MAG TPA: IclR family transcriptional regulator C-terminal domain-containing protein [Propionibacteriaceae bacterium]|jgi:IclR family transcriptional regulator, pca regulon regulatory protein|nr:IclR family transcriptional regulator C-terminal domain-containing protein [Propionibacteriaceae bacterium]